LNLNFLFNRARVYKTSWIERVMNLLCESSIEIMICPIHIVRAPNLSSQSRRRFAIMTVIALTLKKKRLPQRIPKLIMTSIIHKDTATL
jgi:hypothetical protein